MRVQLLCVSKSPEEWVRLAANEYAKRLKHEFEFHIRQVSPASHLSDRPARLKAEAVRIEKACNKGARRIALDEAGRCKSTREIATSIETWRQDARNVDLIIGGAEGLDTSIKIGADELWSLSSLTFPHQLVRVIVIEQLYRACSILNKHPYHRA